MQKVLSVSTVPPLLAAKNNLINYIITENIIPQIR